MILISQLRLCAMSMSYLCPCFACDNGKLIMVSDSVKILDSSWLDIRKELGW